MWGAGDAQSAYNTHIMSRIPLASAARVGLLAVVALALLTARGLAVARADEGWVIRSFDARYDIQEAGAVTVTEEISVDFGTLEKHGIFRDIPVQYRYDDTNDRLIPVSNVNVEGRDGPLRFELITGGPNLRIKIGDPDKTVTGEQEYRITYILAGALNPFPDHDEFYWNVTGNEWPVTIEAATAAVVLPGQVIQDVACFQGPTGSQVPCDDTQREERAVRFAAATPLGEGSGLTIVVGLEKGAVLAVAPILVPRAEEKSEWDQWVENMGVNKPMPLALAALAGVAAVAAIARLWWMAGRDRWFGDMFYLSESPREETKPVGARETVVVEYQPPEVNRRERRLRPAEIGLLLDERADTLDVSATIVDMAVRKYLVIAETESGGLLGLFKKKDYELTRLEKPDDDLLPYERRLLGALFDDGATVKLSDLKNKFHTDLAKVKEDLYEESVKDLKLFSRDPDQVRTMYRIAGGAAAAAGVGAAYALTYAGAGIIGVPVVFGGMALAGLSHLMPRRTAKGRLLYRRCLGFRLYMTTAETERQKFAEKANLFDEYLPYAIVYGCVEKWAKAFEGLGLEDRDMGWYVGTHPFAPVAFASTVSDFSSSVSTVMASTPGGSGGSGFGGGGGSGGGGGGGGGGSW